MSLTRRVRPAAIVLLVLLCGAFPIARARSAPSPGIYLDVPGTSGDEGRIRLRGVMVTQVKQTGMWKSIASQGFASSPMVGTIEGAHAAVRAPSGDVTFYVYLDPRPSSNQMNMEDAMKMMSGDGMPPNIRSAEEILLLHMTVKDNARQAQVGTSGRGGISHKSKDSLPCTVEKIGDGAFRVKPNGPLAPGEYAFSAMGEGNGSQLWDFGVDGK